MPDRRQHADRRGQDHPGPVAGPRFARQDRPHALRRRNRAVALGCGALRRKREALSARPRLRSTGPVRGWRRRIRRAREPHLTGQGTRKMKAFVIAFVVIVLAALGAMLALSHLRVSAPARLVSESRALTGFHRLEIRGLAEVTLVQGGNEGVTLEGS